ncbi:MAG: single-stranded-DNA-specific exonuclease RecJ [Parcubacteria group bacterium]
MKNWKIKKKKEDFLVSLLEKYDPAILGLLYERGIAGEEAIEKYFGFDYAGCLGDPFKIVGMEKAVERIKSAKEKKEPVAIYGDYDADGVTATAVLKEALMDVGFPEVICYFPDRQTEGYGLNEKALEHLKAQGVKLIITVDCGITNVVEVEKAKDWGMDIIITDHHHVPDELPAAVALINPNIPESGFEFKELAGVGVAFKLATALYERLAKKKSEQLKWALDLVAIGTIADCVPLLGENRVLVKYGLLVLSKTRRVGLLEMFKVGRINISEDNVPDAHTVAFQIAPRINAAGRIDHASASYNVLVGDDPVAARVLALELEDKNQKRQKITIEIFREVQVLANNSFKDRRFIFASNAHWPMGILGLVAGKITEEFKKPSMILQHQEGMFRGSLRSVPEVDLMEIIKRCATLVEKFGGHSQAAGVSVLPENIEKFCAKMAAEVEKELEGKEIMSVIEIDSEISAEDIGWELVSGLKKMEPFGVGNREPIFCARNFIIVDAKIVGNGQKHWKLTLRGENGSPKIFDAIGFSLVEKFPNLEKDVKIDIAFNLAEDEWNGNKKIQIKIIDLKLVENS